MSETRWTPGEFERLVSLPADDPERRRAETSPAFQERLRMQGAFTAPPDAPLEPGERAGAEQSGWISSRLRPALAFVAVLAVAAIGWWMLGEGRAPNALQGTAPEVAVIALAEPVARRGGVELAWKVVPGAETYRVVIYGDRLEELARLDGLEVRGVLLRAETLPAGLPRGAEVAVEVQALLHGEVIATSRVLSLRLP